MKTMSLAYALVSATLLSDAATASTYVIRARPEDRAMTAYPAATPLPQRLFHSCRDCGADRPSAVQDASGKMLGYECVNNANGSQRLQTNAPRAMLKQSRSRESR